MKFLGSGLGAGRVSAGLGLGAGRVEGAFLGWVTTSL